jgi:hypothetical protein
MNIYMKLSPPDLRRPFRAFHYPYIKLRACALGFPAGPLRGPEFATVTNSVPGIL